MASFKLGRVRPRARGPRLSLKNYLMATLPAAPVSANYTLNGTPFLKDILGNDKLGDCTCAGIFHIIGAALANANQEVPFTTADTIGLYERACGYNPSDPTTDGGGQEPDVLNYVQNNGLLPDGSHKIAGWLAVDGSSKEQISSAIYIFENVYFGVELPDAWISETRGDGFVWGIQGDVNPQNGHCFVGLGYNEQGVIVDSWGLIGTITWEAIAKYATTPNSGELYTVLTKDALDKIKQKAPNGFDWTQLVADFDSIGGNLMA